MSRQNPLQPKSSLLEKKSSNRSGLQMVLIIMAVHVVFLGGLLFSGCRQENSIPPLVGKTNSIPSLPPIVDVAAPQSQTNNVNVVDAPPIAERTNTLASGPPLPIPPDIKSQSLDGSDQFVSEVVPLVPVQTPDSTEVPINSNQSEYIVLKGDNYTAIARKHSVTIAALKEVNPAVDPNRIAIGQVLVIPAPLLQNAEPELLEGVITYEVKAGDNLYTIAKNHKTTVKVIRDENNLKTNNIRPGQKLIIPKTVSE